MLRLRPITIKAANELVKVWHRHHKPTVGGLFAVAVHDGENFRGAAIIGRPVARMLQDGETAEVVRCVTDGAPNACSMLYGAAWRACRALGYKRLLTYILEGETGVSLTAAGWKCLGQAGGGKWSRPSREREDDHPTQRKLRFERTDPATN